MLSYQVMETQITLCDITPMVVGVYRDWPGCSASIWNIFHYGSNLTFSGIQVKSMQNVKCISKNCEEYNYEVYYILCNKLRHFTNCPSSFSSFPMKPSVLYIVSALHLNLSNFAQHAQWSCSSSSVYNIFSCPILPSEYGHIIILYGIP